MRFCTLTLAALLAVAFYAHGSAVALINQRSGRCLDVPGSTTGDIRLAQYGCHFGANQLWYH